MVAPTGTPEREIGLTTVAALLLVPFAAACGCVLLALVSLVRKTPSLATWCFFAGMIALGIDSTFNGLAMVASQPQTAVTWLTRSWIVKSLLPLLWVAFSLTYSRGDYREFLVRWRPALIAFALLPLIALATQNQILQLVSRPESAGRLVLQVSAIGKALNAVFILALVVILMNLEQTFRSAVGTMRWRIKFVILAFAVMFGTSIYVHTQVILFSDHNAALLLVQSAGVLIGCLCLTVAYARTGWTEIDVYPSLAVLRSSFTMIVVGGYLFAVGVAAQLVKRFGGAEIFQFQALIVLLGITGLAVLLLSDRARQRMESFTARHFGKAQHDSVRVWSTFSRRLANVKDQAGLSAVCARLISETFEALSVTVWLLDDEKRQLVMGASTGQSDDVAGTRVAPALASMSAPFDLDEIDAPWAEEFRASNRTAFPNGANRLCVPLRLGDQPLGAVVLADRVNGAPYSAEDIELLKCIADQIASVLLNLRLAGEVARARELEAFRTMSTFFVHDLKNAATTLNLMLKNLPLHFHDPAFREDALRGIGMTARRIEETIARLTELRQRPEIIRVESDLNELVSDALEKVRGLPDVEVIHELQPVPTILADRDQVQSVVTNLVLNAREAVGSGGHIKVRTELRDRRVVLSVADNGCGMSQAFVKDSLFRPFRSTKKQGLGIGLFQSRAIVRAHGGGMHVESEVGKGTTFLVSFPITGEK